MLYILFGKFKQKVVDLKWQSGSRSVKHLFTRALAVYECLVKWEKDGGTLWIHTRDGQQHKLNIKEEEV